MRSIQCRAYLLIPKEISLPFTRQLRMPVDMEKWSLTAMQHRTVITTAFGRKNIRSSVIQPLPSDINRDAADIPVSAPRYTVKAMPSG